MSLMQYRWARSIVPLLLLTSAACSSLPAKIPPQLQHTPGPMLVVGERTLQTAVYQVDPPAGWRIVKSTIASEPIVLVMVAPDESMTIQIGDEPQPPLADDPEMVVQEAVVTLPNGQQVYMMGQGQREVADLFQAQFASVQRSVRELE